MVGQKTRDIKHSPAESPGSGVPVALTPKEDEIQRQPAITPPAPPATDTPAAAGPAGRPPPPAARRLASERALRVQPAPRIRLRVAPTASAASPLQLVPQQHVQVGPQRQRPRALRQPVRPRALGRRTAPPRPNCAGAPGSARGRRAGTRAGSRASEPRRAGGPRPVRGRGAGPRARRGRGISRSWPRTCPW
jgi:hypothetical protein